MAGFGDLVQKAFYLGVGLASYAGEKAGSTLADLRVQAQKLADEMVARGEISTEEARRMVEEMMNRAQQPVEGEPEKPAEPRRIEILTDDEPLPQSASQPTAEPSADSSQVSSQPTVDDLRQQVAKLQEELRRLKRD
ncbi:phasin family protein [Thermoleptolyngbya sp.]|jgi:polyhydroxyalkanoate synthesis regulator phasin